MSVKIRGAVPVALCPRPLDKVCTWKSGAAAPGCATFARSYITGLWERRGGGDRGKNLQAETRCILYRRSPAKFRFVANITTACQHEIKSEVRLAVAVAAASPPGSLFSDDMTLDKPWERTRVLAIIADDNFAPRWPKAIVNAVSIG